MIELEMVHRMLRRGALVAPVLAASAWLLGGPRAAGSAAVGLGLALANLWLAGRIIGGVADNQPALLLGAGLGAFAAGLAVVTGAALALQALGVVEFPVTGLVLIGSHLGLVLWEGARAFPVKKVSQVTTR